MPSKDNPLGTPRPSGYGGSMPGRSHSRRRRSYQQPIQFDEHRASEAVFSPNGVRVDVFEGWTPYASVTEELGRDKGSAHYNDHSHKVYINGRLVYERDTNGTVIVNREK